MHNMHQDIQQHLAQAGYKSEWASIRHLADLHADVEHALTSRNTGYPEVAARYALKYDFELPADFPTAQSIIVTAAPHPKICVTFEVAGKHYPVIIPPTYLHDTDNAILAILAQDTCQYGYRVRDAILPTKPLAVHSGLATYGKNNIAYIAGLGSFFRLRAFFSDIPCPPENWYPLTLMEQCATCTVCRKKCPTQAIPDDGFLLDVTRCLTYRNEGAEEFPEWIDPGWHNCLIGCMRCQDSCPANRAQQDWVAPGETFTEEETLMILEGRFPQQFPENTRDKLKKLSMLDDAGLLQRNLSALMNSSFSQPD